MRLYALSILCCFVSIGLFAVTALDFSSYRLGKNNRYLFEAIVKDLSLEFGREVTTAYGKGLQAIADRIVIDESQMDDFLKQTTDPKEREALARFIIAHEYFHVALKHTHTDQWGKKTPEIEIRGTFKEARKQMEKQVDYLAAKYLQTLKLPTTPVQTMFLEHPEFHGGEYYPTAEERVEVVVSAIEKGIDRAVFDHKAIKCTFLLGLLSTKLP